MFRDLFGKTYIHLILIAAIGLIVYSNTFDVPFQWDEEEFIARNPIVKDFSYFAHPSRAKGLTLSEGNDVYALLKSRYVGYFTFALNYRIHGLDVAGYHVVNVAIHLINALLVYFLVSLTFKTPFLSSSSLKEHSHYMALFASLLFVSHPIQTEAVTYIFQRLASLAAFFYLLSIVLYIKWRLRSVVIPAKAGIQSPTISAANVTGFRVKPGMTKKTFLYLLSLLSAVLAMKTKENAFTLPLAVTIYEFIFFNSPLRRRLLYLAPVLLTILIIPLSLGTGKPAGEIISHHSDLSIKEGESISRWDYLFTQFRVIVTYIRLLFFPINQTIDYNFPIYRSILSSQVFFSLIFFISVLVFGLYLLYRSKSSPLFRFITFGIFWFYTTLSVESSIIPLQTLINEYRVYLPSIGLFVAITAASSFLFQKLRSRSVIAVMIIAVAFLQLILMCSTYARNNVWKSKISLWRDAVSKASRNPRSFYNLGLAYQQGGDLNNALDCLLTAKRLHPGSEMIERSIGNVYVSRGEADNAIVHYLLAVNINRDSKEAHSSLGYVYLYMKDLPARAVPHYLIALSLNPDDAETHRRLSIAYNRLGLFEKAKQHSDRHIALSSGVLSPR